MCFYLKCVLKRFCDEIQNDIQGNLFKRKNFKYLFIPMLRITLRHDTLSFNLFVANNSRRFHKS